jgi:hypothetical protein
MKCANSPNESASHRTFDLVLEPDDSESGSQLIQPRQINGMNQMNALIQYANLST